jgi:DNA polymerase III gamma/tau subunit
MDFKEINAAQHSGVENARLIAAPDGWGEAPPSIARRRVTLIDEAHRLSSAAWDVYLKPLEMEIDYSTYLFVTSEGQSIPMTIRSRCTRVRFVKVSEENIFGLLMATAAHDKAPYKTDALKLIAHRSEGAPRNAMEYFGRVAAMGGITVEMVEAVIDNTLENKCDTLWWALVTKDQKAAAKIAGDLAVSNTPAAIIETMCLVYSTAVREPETELHNAVRDVYNNIAAATTLFLKWMGAPALPADAIQLFVYELMYLSPRVIKVAPKPPALVEEAKQPAVSADELFQ